LETIDLHDHFRSRTIAAGQKGEAQYAQETSIEGRRMDLAHAIGQFLFHRWLKKTTPGEKTRASSRKA
jgi:hypothetical protein